MSDREIITSKRTGDSCIHVKHKSGLDVYIREMAGFSSVYALFGTKYGSVNTTFKLAADEEYTEVPNGIAHFLEHKLFENEDCGVFELFAKTGAQCNAYTSFDKTCYLFSCTKDYTENLRILLDFVQKPYFTKENVDKEQGIIGQEIRMTNDNPEWRVLFNMLRGMYHSHPVQIDIAGTEDSIAQIDADLLYKCYDTFYNLNNMTLSIAGNIKADEVLAICDEMLRPCEDKGLETVFPDEPDDIVQAEIREKQSVGASIFQFGYKCLPCKEDFLRKEMTASLAVSYLTDASSEMYNRLLSDGIINASFGGEVFAGDGFFTVIFSGESEYPETVKEALITEIKRITDEGINEKIFNRIKKATYGDLVRQLCNVTAAASVMINTHMAGCKPFDVVDIVSELTAEDALSFIRNELLPEKTVLSVIEKI
ncbi:MAG: insulinase family protein [Ruminococcus sp.]|nr:insulinase family protein [Ruminococcus sp.]